MFSRVALYMRKVVQRSGWNRRQFGSSNNALWTSCGRGPFSGERDTPADIRGVGAVLAQWMGMALRPGPACFAICCRRRGRRRCRCGRDRARAGNRRAAVLRATGLLCPARLLLCPAGILRSASLLLWAATSGEPLMPTEAGDHMVRIPPRSPAGRRSWQPPSMSCRDCS